MDLKEVLKALAHENRLRILNLLKQQQLCVGELENIMQENQSNVSRHLGKLKQVSLIKAEQNAQWVYYNINEDLFARHIFLQNILDGEIDDLNVCQEDNKRLEKYQASDLTCEDLKNCNLFE